MNAPIHSTIKLSNSLIVILSTHNLQCISSFIPKQKQIKIEFIIYSEQHFFTHLLLEILLFPMLVSCPFCKQILIQAYQHVQFMYALCLKCFTHMVREFKVYDFQRVSLFAEKGSQKIDRLRKVNDQLRLFLETKMLNFTQAMKKHLIEEYFDRTNDTRKSQESSISTSPSFTFESEENPQNQSKPHPEAQQNSTIQALSIIKDKLTSTVASTGMNIIEKIKESQKIEKQVENLNNYKDKIIEKSDQVKNKLSKIRTDFKEIRSQLPSLKETIKGMELGSMLKSRFFGKW